jgi:hypothetical protein
MSCHLQRLFLQAVRPSNKKLTRSAFLVFDRPACPSRHAAATEHPALPFNHRSPTSLAPWMERHAQSAPHCSVSRHGFTGPRKNPLLYQGMSFTARGRSGFVSGHDFSRAIKDRRAAPSLCSVARRAHPGTLLRPNTPVSVQSPEPNIPGSGMQRHAQSALLRITTRLHRLAEKSALVSGHDSSSR